MMMMMTMTTFISRATTHFTSRAFFSSSLRHSSASTLEYSRNDEVASLMGLGQLNHVAIAVNNLKESTKLYKDVLGATVSNPLPLPEHGVTTVFVTLGNSKLELLEPLGEKSPIRKFLEKNTKGGIHHVCIEVKDIHKAVELVKQKGVRLIDEIPKIGAHGKPVVFVHPSSMDGVLVELEQE